MATHLHRRTRAAAGGPALARSCPGAKLLNAVQWGLVLLGLCGLFGAVAVIASTPEAWPL
ncbi:MAG: hypothetical protein E2583_18260 [Comamonas sp.]|nr:hypothetical protein [Comamonas sp.]